MSQRSIHHTHTHTHTHAQWLRDTVSVEVGPRPSFPTTALAGWGGSHRPLGCGSTRVLGGGLLLMRVEDGRAKSLLTTTKIHNDRLDHHERRITESKRKPAGNQRFEKPEKDKRHQHPVIPREGAQKEAGTPRTTARRVNPKTHTKSSNC